MREPRVIVTLAAAALSGLVSIRLAAGVALLHECWRAWRFVASSRPDALLAPVGRRPAEVLVISFAALIAVGTFVLFLPAAARAGQSVRLIDAFFTAVSATCVTGLTTLDGAVTWSTFGLFAIALLIQLGGLGIMTVAAFTTIAVGRGLTLRQGALLQNAFDVPDAAEMRMLIKAVVVWTLTIESLGASILLLRFGAQMPFERAAAYALFHAVSAFCNAGFALYSDSLVRFVSDPVVNITMGALIILGGFGFGVLVALVRVALAPGRRRLPVHAKLVLVSSLLLTWLGALVYFFLEYDCSLSHLGLGEKIMAAVFQSISLRTAGFNTVPIEGVHQATLLFMTGLMFVGASPGSTGGGIKTTTFAVLVLALRALLAEKCDLEVFDRRVPQAVVFRAFALTSGAVLVLFAGVMSLLITEKLSPHVLMFEAVSALGTVGLTLGATSKLSVAGRLVVCVLMFVGRLGPLTVLAAAGRSGSSARYSLPEERILVG